MAPTVWLPELSVVKRAEYLHTIRRKRISHFLKRVQQKQLLQRLTYMVEHPDFEESSPMENFLDKDNNWHKSFDIDISSPDLLSAVCTVNDDSDRDLFKVTFRTMSLVRRNNILQERINALRAETHDFIQSVLNNPQNKSKQGEETNHCEDATVSSSTDEIILEPVSLHVPSLRNSSPDIVTSTCSSENKD